MNVDGIEMRSTEIEKSETRGDVIVLVLLHNRKNLKEE
jgi:hypothetical protein